MTKIDIYSGFLGAGKTTLIRKMISEAYTGEKLVLIENEFGDIGIDSGFLQDAGIAIREMNAGCICCSLVGDFGEALRRVVAEYAPDRIVIEPSGVGKLSDVIRAVRDNAEAGVTLNAFTTVVDAGKANMYRKNFGEFFNDQVEHAGAIVMSHTDTASPERLETAVALMRTQNPDAVLITTPIAQLDGRTLLEAVERRASLHTALEHLMRETDTAHKHHDHDHDEDCDCGCHDHDHGHHHADEVFVSWGRETTGVFQKEKLLAALEELFDEGKYGMVLRAKGIVAGDDGNWLHFDYIPGEAQVRTGAAAVTGRLCVIGAGLREGALSLLFGVN